MKKQIAAIGLAALFATALSSASFAQATSGPQSDPSGPPSASASTPDTAVTRDHTTQDSAAPAERGH